MKHYLIIIFFVVTSCPVLGQSEEWVRHVGSSDFVWLQNVHAHDNGTTYIIGNYSQEACIDDGQSNYNCFYNDITGIPNSSNTFLAALDENGQFMWGNYIPLWIGGSAFLYNSEVKITSDTLGNLFLLGNLSDTIDAVFKDGNTLSFEPGPYESCLLLKLNSLGNFLNSYQFDGRVAGHTLGVVDEEIIITGHHSISTTGYFADFEPGSGIHIYNETGMFLMKLNNQFTLQWMRHIEGDIRAKDAAVDADGNIILTGEFSGDLVDFKGYGTPYYLSSRQTEVFDGFLLKFDGDGFFQWARSTLFTNYVYSPFISQPYIESVSLDTYNDSIYVVGHTGTEYDAGYTIEPNQNDSIFINKQSMFLASHSPSGELNWLEEFTTTDPDSGFFEPDLVRVNKQGAYISGIYSEPVSFGTLANNKRHYISGIFDGFVLKVDRNKGLFKWVNLYKGKTSISYKTSPNNFFTQNGDIFIVGEFKDSSLVYSSLEDTFLITTNTFCDVTSNNCTNSFIHKFRDPDYEEEIVPKPEFDLNIFPNPTGGSVEVNFGKSVENLTLHIYDLRGKKVIDRYYSDENESIFLDLVHLESSVYIIKIKAQDQEHIRKLIIQQ